MSLWDHPIKAVIFDCDGTILDTNKIYFKANGAVTGREYPPELSKQTNGRGEKDVSRIIVDYYHLPMTPQEFIAKRNVILTKTLPNCQIIPHVDDLIKKIKKMGLKMAVATSCVRHFHELKTSNHKELFSLFDCDICGDEVNQAKPHPDIFLNAATKLGNFKSENTLVIEDAAAGVKAANNAGMPVVVCHKNDADFHTNLDEFGAKPTAIIESFDKFDFSLFNWES